MRAFEEIVEDLDHDGFGHYMAGFLDGEASFVIARVNSGFTCRMQVKLRDDDAAILFALRDRTGLGLVRPEKVYQRSDRGSMRNTHPQMTWIVGNKADCAMLVRLLERYPLRAKKRQDFEVWRLAVRERAVKRHRGGWETMAALHAQLAAGRQYDTSHQVAFTIDPAVFDAGRMELLNGSVA